MVSGPDPAPSKPAPEWLSPAWDIFTRRGFGAFAVLKHAAFVRDLDVRGFTPAFYSVSDGTRRIAFWEHTPETTTFVARRVSVSKPLTKAVLENAGVRVPGGKDFSRDRPEAGWRFAESIGVPVVVKPTTGEGGSGVTPNVTAEDQFRQAWARAGKASARGRILVEKHVPGNDFRLFVVADRVAAATRRVPAFVEGDGQSTVAELVIRKSEARRSNPYLDRVPMRLSAGMVHNLSVMGMTPETVLTRGRRLTLHPIANITAGGENIDVSEMVHPEFQEIAVRACRAVPGTISVGVDVLVEDISAPPSAQEWAVCEINTTPGIAMHHFPVAGMPRDAAGALIEHLFPGRQRCPPSEQREVRVFVSGDVTGKGFRNWIWRRAQLRGLTGWVGNRRATAVEAVFLGAPRAVENMIDECRAGPRKATVEDVVFEPSTERPADGFEIRY